MSKTGSSSYQCTTTLYGENKETQKSVNINQLWLRIMLADSRSDVGHFWDLYQRRNGTELLLDRTAERMMLNFAESRHPIFRATSSLERGEFRSKEKENMSIHFNGSEENIELILRTVISANQLSVRSSGRSVQRTVQRFQSSRET